MPCASADRRAAAHRCNACRLPPAVDAPAVSGGGASGSSRSAAPISANTCSQKRPAITKRRFCAPRVATLPPVAAGAAGANDRLVSHPRHVRARESHQQRAVLDHIAPDFGRIFADRCGPDLDRGAARAQHPALRHPIHDARVARGGLPFGGVLARLGLGELDGAPGLAGGARDVLIGDIAVGVDALDDIALPARRDGKQHQGQADASTANQRNAPRGCGVSLRYHASS